MTAPLKFVAAAACLAALCGCRGPDRHAGETSATDPRRGRVVHVVLCWLKDPRNQEVRQRIARTSHGFIRLPGVVQVTVGTPVITSGAADDPYDLAVVIQFRDRQSLDRYERDPEHLKARQELLKPNVRRVQIYDILADGPGQ